MKLWVDDERDVPEGWYGVKTYWDAMYILRTQYVSHLSLDHDLGDFDKLTGREMTGYDILLYLIDPDNRMTIPEVVTVHSANGPAGDRMRGVIERYIAPVSPRVSTPTKG